MIRYEVGFPSERVKKDFYKKLEKLTLKDKNHILQEIEKLSFNPRPPGKSFKYLKGELIIFQFIAQCRLRVGNYRIFYDIDEKNKKVVLLWIDRKSERTYI